MGEAAKRAVGVSENQLPDMSSFASSVTEIGFYSLPGGLEIRWGYAVAHTVTTPVKFARPFKERAFVVIPTKFTEDGRYVTSVNIQKDGFTLCGWLNAGGQAQIDTYGYIALGF
ncbi:gp53-like domain-containing protein [Chimaeribacter arupi]|uniref:gp53-like domain-containing protein n=1 Tax=Chimaeribacter arupi TaxID=2060066 RepID=UPI00374EF2C9